MQSAGNNPLLTVLNYSGGKQSAMLFWLVIDGEIELPPSFAVINSNPGMENTLTYEYHLQVQEACKKYGIHYECAPGPNLYEDLLAAGEGKVDRIDNPPYWTLSEKGKVGRLRQACTDYYKIAPMDRVVRRLLHERFGVSPITRRPGVREADGTFRCTNIVEKWIGFAADETQRNSESRQDYAYFRYPLQEMGIRKIDCENWYTHTSRNAPPRSVCNACFANGLATFKDMHDNRPADWQQAVKVDEAVRDMSKYGVRDQVFVSATCYPLRQLAAQGFVLTPEQVEARRRRKPNNETVFETKGMQEEINKLGDNDGEAEWMCDKGVCFV